MIEVSIIIVNWNTHDYLQRCLKAVYDSISDVDFEVIVVDNASVDESVAMVCREFPQVHLIVNQENTGFARANNQALAIARGQYSLLLNTDAFLHKGTVKTLLSHMELHPDTGVAGCKLLYEDGTVQRSCSAFPTVLTELWQLLWLDRLFPKSEVFGKYLMTYWDLNDMREVDAVLGACMLIRREVVAQVGPLHEQYFMYSEEVDFCYRVKQNGWKVRFVSNATATHIWGGSAQQVPVTSFLRLYKSRVLFFREHYGKFITYVYKSVLILGSIIRVLIGPLHYGVSKDKDILHRFRNFWFLLRNIWVY